MGSYSRPSSSKQAGRKFRSLTSVMVRCVAVQGMECPVCPHGFNGAASHHPPPVSPLLLKADVRGMANGKVLLFSSLFLDE